MLPSTALVAVWMAMYLTSYSDYQTGFQEPLSPPYGCHTGLMITVTAVGWMC